MISKRFRKPRKLIATFLSTVLSLVFVAAISQSRSVYAVSDPLRTGPALSPTLTDEPRITFDPSDPSVAAGTKVTITATVFDKDGKKVTPKPEDKWTWKIADASLEDFLLLKPDGNKASVVGLLGDSKSVAAKPNLIPIIVTFSGTQNATGVVNVRLTDAPLARGPIPPGIEPQVDVMWAVMPQKITHDNFGSKIKKQYYGIEVVIGHDSGFDLELASVGFDLGAGDLNIDGLKGTKIPTSGYRVTRASLQRRQLLSLRNMTLNTIKALGPVLTGFTPFFHNVNHTNNFTEGINILSNPIEKGFELVWPDLTLGQLANLEDQSLRDNAITRTVVKNNTQVRFVIFVPKDLINYPSDKDDRTWREWRDKPLEVMKKLGRIILIGDQVEHINRVRVVSSAETGTAFSISGRVTDPCAEGIEGVTMTLTQAGGFSSTTTTREDGTYSFNNVPAGLTYSVTASKTGTIFSSTSGTSFTLHGNRANVDFNADQAPFTISGKITKPDGTPIEEGERKAIKLELASKSATPKFETRTADLDKDGGYKFPDVPGGATYIVTPKLKGRAFNPKDSGSIPSLDCGQRKKEHNFELEPKKEG